MAINGSNNNVNSTGPTSPTGTGGTASSVGGQPNNNVKSNPPATGPVKVPRKSTTFQSLDEVISMGITSLKTGINRLEALADAKNVSFFGTAKRKTEKFIRDFLDNPHNVSITIANNLMSRVDSGMRNAPQSGRQAISVLGNMLTESFGLKTSDVLKKTMMVDIETQGLGRYAPILQVAVGFQDINKDIPLWKTTPATSMTVAGDISKIDTSGIKDYGPIFPVKIERRDKPFRDSAGNWQKPDWQQIPKAIMTKDEFLEMGEWGMDPKYGMGELFEELEKLSPQELADIEKQVHTEDFVEVAGKRYKTPRGVAAELLVDLLEAKKGGYNVAGANISFESVRLGNLLNAYIRSPDGREFRGTSQASTSHPLIKPINDHPDVVKALGREVKSIEDLEQVFENVPGWRGLHRPLDSTNQAFNEALATMRLRQGGSSKIIDLMRLWQQDTDLGVRNIDLQRSAEFFFSGFHQTHMAYDKAPRELMRNERMGDVINFRSVEVLADIFYGIKEEHTASADVKIQQSLLRDLDIAANQMQKVYETSRSTDFLKRVHGLFTTAVAYNSENFQKMVNLSYARDSVVEDLSRFQDPLSVMLTNNNLPLSGKGNTFNDLARQRGIDRSLVLLHETVESMVGGKEASKLAAEVVDVDGVKYLMAKSEPFSLAINPLISPKWETIRHADGKITRRMRLSGQDRDLYFRMTEKAQSLLSEGMSQNDVKEEIANQLLDRYASQPNVMQSSSHPLLSRIELGDRYDVISKNYASDRDAIWEELFEKTDKDFNTSIRSMIKEVADRGEGLINFRKWAVNRYAGTAAALIGGGLGLGMLAASVFGAGVDNEGDEDEIRLEEVINDRTNITSAVDSFMSESPSEVLRRNPEGYMNLYKNNPFFVAKAAEEEAKRNLPSSNMGTRLINSFLSDGLSEDDYSVRSTGSTDNAHGFGNKRTVKMDRFDMYATDGDTLSLQRKGLAGLFTAPITVRMQGIDTPEVYHSDMEGTMYQEQYGGRAAGAALSGILQRGGNQLVVDSGEGSYGRAIGNVYQQGQSVSKEMLSEGYGLATKGYKGQDPGEVDAAMAAEKQARKERRGIWMNSQYEEMARTGKKDKPRLTFNALVSPDRVAIEKDTRKIFENMYKTDSKMDKTLTFPDNLALKRRGASRESLGVIGDSSSGHVDNSGIQAALELSNSSFYKENISRPVPSSLKTRGARNASPPGRDSEMNPATHERMLWQERNQKEAIMMMMRENPGRSPQRR